MRGGDPVGARTCPAKPRLPARTGVDGLPQRRLEVDDLGAGELSAADLAVTGALIQTLRCGLHDAGVEPQAAVSEACARVPRAGPGSAGRTRGAERRVYADPLPLADRVGDVAQSADRDLSSVAQTDEELAAVVQVRGRNGVKVVIPPTGGAIDSHRGERQVVQLRTARWSPASQRRTGCIGGSVSSAHGAGRTVAVCYSPAGASR